MDLAVATHFAVESFLPAHRFAYGNQIRRAAISVASNIAEGAARKHPKELVQFLFIARGSLSELHTQFCLAAKVGLCTPEQIDHVHELIDHTGRMLTRMLKALDPERPRAFSKERTVMSVHR